MSYLLTEIALEMLGYKFYDIYGVPDDINNFQNVAASDRSANDATSIEPHLSTLLGLDPKSSKRNHTNPMLINLPDGVTKLMDAEYNKVRQQLVRKKLSLTGEYPDPKTIQTTIQILIESEHEKLLAEQQLLQRFRRIVEENLMNMNTVSFEKYLEGFKSTSSTSKSLASEVMN
ncbi:uncharacterized protein LOC106083376 [Stomoxys calcitrans]|uniref:Uncharacterized protein n=1 Tax=Stomoxys calcitrans TaxID=35570 RepID=A0A1I8Q832_STOCA|nr:uncharacterized protein LOC106083376 [Stomoxys calcitrans]